MDGSLTSEVPPDLVVAISEDYLNRIIKADLEEQTLHGVKEANGSQSRFKRRLT